MSAVEEIQSAIDTLGTMQAVSDSGAWTVAGIHPDCRIEGEVHFIAGDLYDYDAALIVTLHRTIDAQLAILLDAAARLRVEQNHAGIELHYRHALALTRAINGTI